MIHGLTQLTYLAAAALFILSLRWLSHPKTARRGVGAGVGGMALADRRHAARARDRQLHLDRHRRGRRDWHRRSAVVGAAHGGPAADGAVARVRRPCRRPRRHGEIHDLVQHGELTTFRTAAIVLEIILGYLTFTGSLMAAGKLQEIVPTRPITYPNQNVVNLSLLAIAIGAGVYLTIDPYLPWAFGADRPAVARSSASC